MDIETLRKYCLQKPSVTESFPFGESTLVFKVAGKIFLLASLDSSPLQCNMKCEPSQAETYREEYASVVPGYHMNKKHWNTVLFDGSVPAKVIREMVDASFALVVGTLPVKERQKISAYK